jgi:hypothetical protein
VADFFASWLSNLKDELDEIRESEQKSPLKGIVELNQIKRNFVISFQPKIDRPVTTVSNNDRYTYFHTLFIQNKNRIHLR